MQVIDTEKLRAELVRMWKEMPIPDDPTAEELSYAASQRRAAQAGAELSVYLITELERNDVQAGEIMAATAGVLANCLFNFFEKMELSKAALKEIRSTAPSARADTDQEISTHKAIHSFMPILDNALHLMLQDHYKGADEELMANSRQAVDIPRREVGDA